MATKRSLEVLLHETKIYEMINRRLVQAGPDISLSAAIEIMQQKKSGYIVIADGKKVSGIITEVDLVRKVLAKGEDLNQPVRKFMTPDPKVLMPEDPVGKAVDLMGQNRFYHIPLVNEKQELTGVVSVRSIIRFLSELYPTEIYNLPPNPDQIVETAEGG